jgi:hypothetical protein
MVKELEYLYLSLGMIGAIQKIIAIRSQAGLL